MAGLFSAAAFGTARAQSAPPDLSDPQVAHVAVTANAIDIDLAKYAQTRTRNKEVADFAATMIRDHSAVNKQAAALAQKLNVTPADNAVSQSLQAGAREARTKLQAVKGSAFDGAYVEREIGYHQAVLDAIDQVLVPTTDNAELKKLLTDVRPAVAAHLEHAKQLRTTLASAK
jgi:putative membrane protein